jgi:hypothetical protein
MFQTLQKDEQNLHKKSSGNSKEKKSHIDHTEVRQEYANMLENNVQAAQMKVAPVQLLEKEKEPLQGKGLNNSMQFKGQSSEIESNEKSSNLQQDKENNKDGFSSPENAAREFGRRYVKESIDVNLEYAALIYSLEDKKGKKKYFYEKPKIGKTPDEVDFPLITKEGIKKRNIIAYVHTHGEHDPSKDNTIGSKAMGAKSNKKTDWNNTFSYNYKAIENKSMQDVEFANKYEVDGYLIGPDGVLRKYDRKDNLKKEKEAKESYKEKNSDLEDFFYDPVFENLQSISNDNEGADDYKSKLYMDIAKEKKKNKPKLIDDKKFVERFNKEEKIRSKTRKKTRKENMKRIKEEFE